MNEPNEPRKPDPEINERFIKISCYKMPLDSKRVVQDIDDEVVLIMKGDLVFTGYGSIQEDGKADLYLTFKPKEITEVDPEALEQL